MTTAGGHHHRHRVPASIAIDVGAPSPRITNRVSLAYFSSSPGAASSASTTGGTTQQQLNPLERGDSILRGKAKPRVGRAMAAVIVGAMAMALANPSELAEPVARRSPWVSAPSKARRLATAEAKRFSPPTSLMRNL